MHLKSSGSSNFLPLHCRNPAIVGLFRICLNVFVTSFKCQNNVTSSNITTDIILQRQLTSASTPFPCPFKTVTLLFHKAQFFSMGFIGEACSNYLYICDFLRKSTVYITFNNFSIKYLVMCKAYTDVGGIK